MNVLELLDFDELIGGVPKEEQSNSDLLTIVKKLDVKVYLLKKSNHILDSTFRVKLQRLTSSGLVEWSMNKKLKEMQVLIADFEYALGDLMSIPAPNEDDDSDMESNKESDDGSSSDLETREDSKKSFNSNTSEESDHIANYSQNWISALFTKKSKKTQAKTTPTFMQSGEFLLVAALYQLNISSRRGYIPSLSAYLNDSLIQIFSKLLLFCNRKTLMEKLFKFFGMSPLSFVVGYQTGYCNSKEGSLSILAEDSSIRNKWVLVGDSFVAYASDRNSTTLEEILLVDVYFKVEFFNFQTQDSRNQTKPCLLLKNGEKSGKIKLMFSSLLERENWAAKI
ncbi:hypothetical protein ACO0QE_003696 [Hanseniaspora vineae]